MKKTTDAAPIRSEIAGRRAVPFAKAVAAVLGLTGLASALFLFLGSKFALFGVDWGVTYYPATMRLLRGENPYLVPTLHNPVWTLLPLIPFALMGKLPGAIAMYALNFLCYALVAYKVKTKPIAMVAFLMFPLLVFGIAIDNIDSMVLLGMFLPAPLGLFFAAMKPQVGIAAVAYWAYAAWRGGGLRRLVLTFLPVIIATAANFLLYGNWLSNTTDRLLVVQWNATVFPWSLPIGLVLAYIALRQGKLTTAISASPFLSPYVAWYSWPIALVGLLKHERIMVALTAGTWIAFGIVIIPML